MLALLTDGFGGIGGIARYNRNLLFALSAHEAISEIVAMPRLMPLALEQLPAKVKYRTSGLGGKRRYIAATLRELLPWRYFDLIVCGHVNLIPLSALASSALRAPSVCILHGVEAWSPPRGTLSRLLLRKIRHFIAVSELTRERFSAWSGVDPAGVRLLPNTVALEQFGPGPKDPGLMAKYQLSGKRVLLTAGRLDSRERCKGFDEILNVLPDLLARRADLAYLIVGDGTDRDRLEAIVKQRGLERHVHFAGFVPEEQKAAHFRLADVYVMPSRGEGFGIVFLEALASGVPVVASRIDGGREAVMGGKMGILVDPDDPSDLIRGIESALEKPPGSVPDELAHFAFPAFQKRCHDLIDVVLQRPQNAMSAP